MTKVLWNKDKDRSVVAGKIREFAVNPATFSTGKWVVTGWYNSNDSFDFGAFDTKPEAILFLEGLHKQIES